MNRVQLDDGLRIDSIFKPRMRRGTRQGVLSIFVIVFRRGPSGGDLKGRVMTELLMIVGIFVTGGDAKDSTGEDLGL